MTPETPLHIPVLLHETIEGLALQPGDNVVDCTVGAGGHSSVILEKTSPDGRLLGFDLDEAALDAARKKLERYGSRAMLVHESYTRVDSVLADRNFGPVQAALLDLGFSSIEIDDPTRGFSFRFDAPLDMRFDRTQDVTAASIVNGWTEDELAKIFWDFGEERYARKIAEAIVRERRKERITGTFALRDVIAHAVPSFYRHGKIHFATRTYQALRIAVNDELANVREALPKLFDALAPGGRLAVISFHSLEDRIVKEFFKAKAAEGTMTVVTKKPITGSDAELEENPRARSAKLRVAIKTA